MSKKDNTKEYYFGEVEENAIVEYNNATTQSEKNLIYEKYLHKPLTKLVGAIIRKYPKYIGNCGIEELEERTYIHVYNSIAGYDPNLFGKNGQKVKAYSYLGTIAHNYYKTHSQTSYKQESTSDDLGQYNSDYIEEQIKEHYNPHAIDGNDFISDLIETTITEIKDEILYNKRLKLNEIKVGEAIITILKNYKDFFPENENIKIEYTKKGKMKKQKITNFYAKNKIFYVLREVTGLQTKELRSGLIAFKSLYFLNKKLLLEQE